MMDGTFEETEDYALRDITGRLGVADVKAFRLSEDDFEQFLAQLEHTERKETGNVATANGLLKWDILQIAEALKISSRRCA